MRPCRYAASVILNITYGRPSPSSRGDTDILLLNDDIEKVGLALRPGAHLVDELPWLKHIPFYGRSLKRQHQIERDLFRRMMNGVRVDLVRIPLCSSL